MDERDGYEPVRSRSNRPGYQPATGRSRRSGRISPGIAAAAAAVVLAAGVGGGYLAFHKDNGSTPAAAAPPVTTSSASTSAPPAAPASTSEAGPDASECAQIIAAYKAFDQATGSSISYQNLRTSQLELMDAVDHRPDQPAKQLAVLVAQLGVDVSFANMSVTAGQQPDDKVVSDIRADVGHIDSGYVSFKAHCTS